ncbi:glomulin [Pseudomyrmex gracilis]|uniref:glomulin n=1 Tax=Pseudomyrmex gracilis TaxID=219809 RepID=UPI0009959B3C|nr:glomulin [Pseudomyrmex gracilis]
MSQTFVKRFTDLLRDRKLEEVLRLFITEDPKIIDNSMSEIVSVATSYLTESNAQYEQELFECCKTVLVIIAEKYNPMETILEFLGYIEFSNNDTKFCAILEPLRICMIKMNEKSKTIEWCFSTIKSYIEELPMPNSTTDEDAVSDRIMKVYKHIIWFLEPIIQEAVKINCTLEEGSLLGDYLLSFLISLHGKPFCYINRKSTQKETYKKLVEEMITSTFCLTEDILYFLDIVSKRKKTIQRQVQDISHIESYKRSILFQQQDNISNLAYANFYFHVITKKNLWRNVPQVYNPYYILEICMHFFKILLCKEEEILISNGLTFMESVLKRILPRSVDTDILELPIYLDLFKPLINIMVYCNNEVERKKALHIFQEYIEIFNMRARYSVLSYLYKISEISSGLMSLITNIFKSSIIECLNSTPQNPQFLGKNLELMLKKACNLPHGSTTDLVEISDEVITTLNLLRFLYIKDKHNETGIWCITNELKDNYLKPMREGIDLCKTHWRVKMRDLEQQKKNYTKIHDYNMIKKVDAEVTLTIGGQQLPVMPLPEKISFCHRAINGLDVMESILIRVNECIETGKNYQQEF